MRLNSDQTRLIVQGVRRHLGPRAAVWLFGSRLDDSKKGGDVDLYVETESHDLRDELRCKIELEEKLDMPVDLLVRSVQEDSPIARIAKGQGQQLE